MTFEVVRIFSTKDTADEALRLKWEPGKLYIWFSWFDAFILTSGGWALWAPGQSIKQVLEARNE